MRRYGPALDQTKTLKKKTEGVCMLIRGWLSSLPNQIKETKKTLGVLSNEYSYSDQKRHFTTTRRRKQSSVYSLSSREVWRSTSTVNLHRMGVLKKTCPQSNMILTVSLTAVSWHNLGNKVCSSDSTNLYIKWLSEETEDTGHNRKKRSLAPGVVWCKPRK